MKGLLGQAALMFVTSGTICLAQGLAMLLWQNLSFHGLSYLFAFPIVLRGSVQFIYGIHRRLDHPWLIILFLLGIVNMAVGYFIIFSNWLSEIGFILVMGTSWIANGLAIFILALYLHREDEWDSLLILSGMLSLVAGIYVVSNLQRGFASMITVTAVYEIVFGLTVALFGFRARQWNYLHMQEHHWQ